MTSGKPLFAEPPGEDEPGAPDPAPAADERAYRVAPSFARRELTPRDVAHNRNVKALFDHIVPGLPIDADPPETRREAEPLASVIEKTLKRLKIDASPWLDDLTAAWPTLVPPEVAKSARPGKWDNGILYVYVANSVKLFELRRTQLRNIEQAIRRFAGDGRVKQVRLLVDAVPLPFDSRDGAPPDP